MKTDSGGVTSRLGFWPDKGGRWVAVIDRLFGSVFGAAAADPYEAGVRSVEASAPRFNAPLADYWIATSG